MKIKAILSQHRNDFTATMECEHCGHTQKLNSGYHDDFYHERVIPAMTCGGCGKSRAGVAPEVANDDGSGHVAAA
jgi:transcription elongation factor Elf1